MKPKRCIDSNCFRFYFLISFLVPLYLSAQCPVAPENDPYYVIFSYKITRDNQKYCDRLGDCENYIFSEKPTLSGYDRDNDLVNIRVIKNLDYFKPSSCQFQSVDIDTTFQVGLYFYFPLYREFKESNVYRYQRIFRYFNDQFYLVHNTYRSQSLEAIYKTIADDFPAILDEDKCDNPNIFYTDDVTITAAWRRSQLIANPDFNAAPPECLCMPKPTKCKRTVPCSDPSNLNPCFESYDCLKNPCLEDEGCEAFIPTIKVKNL